MRLLTLNMEMHADRIKLLICQPLRPANLSVTTSPWPFSHIWNEPLQHPTVKTCIVRNQDISLVNQAPDIWQIKRFSFQGFSTQSMYCLRSRIDRHTRLPHTIERLHLTQKVPLGQYDLGQHDAERDHLIPLTQPRCLRIQERHYNRPSSHQSAGPWLNCPLIASLNSIKIVQHRIQPTSRQCRMPRHQSAQPAD